jgi:hypothetical protein
MAEFQRSLLEEKMHKFVEDNQLNLGEWHIKRIVGTILEYYEINRYSGTDESFNQLDISLTEGYKGKEIVTNFARSSLNFNLKGRWLGSLSSL